MSGTEEFETLPLDLALARAAAAFKDADFFESSILFWAAVLRPSNPGTTATEHLIVEGLDLEQELGLDVQAEEPIDLVLPGNIDYTHGNVIHLPDTSLSSVQTYILTALCYLSRHINVRIDILPSGQDTLTSAGPPQRYYGSLSPDQKQAYQIMLAIVFATTASIAQSQLSSVSSQEDKETIEERIKSLQTTVLGNEVSTTWQTILPQKRAPHGMPRFFSYLDSSSCTLAGSSIPRNEMDVDALEQTGIRLVITLIKETPLSPSWFHKGETAKRIRNAFVPIENRRAPLFSEVFEVLMGWCVRTGSVESELEPAHHQKATLVHCGGGKGRAGIVLAAHLIRFGLLGHENRGYCQECVSKDNIHGFDLEQFRRGLGDQESTAGSLPTACSSTVDGEDDGDEEEVDDNEAYEEMEDGAVRVVKRGHCLNRYQPMMTAKDAIAHLRELRPGSIESLEQEKAVKAYGEWLWKKSSGKSSRAVFKNPKVVPAPADAANSTSKLVPDAVTSMVDQPEKPKNRKDRKKENVQKAPPPLVVDENEADSFSDDDHERGRKSGKKRGKGGKHMQQDEPRNFVPPPAHKIIKIPASGKGSHHQHHLVVQHNIRAKQLQLQRGQKAKKGGNNHGKGLKERPSFQVSGSPLDAPPKLIILVGLPASGKSHLVTSLLQEFPEHFVRISQDELGSRAVCERLLAQSMRHQQQSLAARGSKKALPMTIIVDRCNPTIAERKEWYEVAFQPDATCMVWFSLGVDKCCERASARDGHPTVSPASGTKVVKSFAKGFEFPNLAKESWCETLVEVGDDAGSDRLREILKGFAKDVAGGATTKTSNDSTPIKARPAFIPARVMQRKKNGATSGLDSGTLPSLSKLSPSKGMERVEEDEEEEDEEDEEDEEEDSQDEHEVDEDSEDEEDEENASDDHHGPESPLELVHPAPAEAVPSAMSITRALQFASLTGHRPAVKKPVKGSVKHSNDSLSDSQFAVQSGTESPRGVSFATPLSTYDRPLQKFPRTPHLFDPLTIRSIRPSAHVSETEKIGGEPGVGRNQAISRTDLLLPPSALDQVFAPKAHQVLTVEEKMDGANIGFSVLHFKRMGYPGAKNAGQSPPPKIRVQNRNHFVHPDDHWQFKRLNGWLERHRKDILWLCEGRWRYETRKKKKEKNGGEDDEDDEDGEDGEDDQDEDEEEEEVVEGEEEEGGEDWEDEEDEDENEYVDEDKVLQDGMAPYVLYGEWLYAKHSVQYTGLRSWFVPFDLFDVKTGTFVSRALFRKAVGQTQLELNTVLTIPDGVYGDVDKTLGWTLKKLNDRSALMQEKEEVQEKVTEDRVEGLYFRIDQGDRLLMRCKVVRPDFIAGEERWGVKEQVANRLTLEAHSY